MREGIKSPLVMLRDEVIEEGKISCILILIRNMIYMVRGGFHFIVFLKYRLFLKDLYNFDLLISF